MTTSRAPAVLYPAAWALVGLYLVWSLGGQQALAGVLDPFSRNLVEQGLLTGFFLAHAFAFLRASEVGMFALICFVVSNLFENMSVMTGFPFGAFHHSEATGPRLFNIPWLATPTYMAMGYVSWILAQLILERRTPFEWRHRVVGVAVVAAFVFSMWDLCNDPVFHTINKAFFYDQPGPWFGVPISNFAGWLFVTLIVYGLYAWWLSRRSAAQLASRPEPAPGWWSQAIAMYAAVAAGGVYRNLNGRAFDIALPSGHVWRSADIYGAMTIATVFTMGFVVVLAVLHLHAGERQRS